MADSDTLMAAAAAQGLYGLAHLNLRRSEVYAKCALISGASAQVLMQGVAANQLYNIDVLETLRALLYAIASSGSQTSAQQLLAIAAANGYFFLQPLDLKRAVLYLLRQSEQTICTPATPTNLASSGLTTSGATVSWTETDISTCPATGFIVFWGTSSGVYGNQSALLPAGTTSYDLSGLTDNTTYYWTVIAYHGSTPSSTPTEQSFTTASASNGLLNGLISYWKFDLTSGSTAVDSVGANDLSLHDGATSGVVAGILNAGLSVGSGASYAEHVSSSDFAMGAGVSWSYSFWIYSSDYTGAGTGSNVHYLGKGDDQNNNDEYLVLVSAFSSPQYKLLFYCWDTNGTSKNIQLTSGPPANGWHHVVIGFDASTNTQFGYFDGVALTPNVMTSNGIRALSAAFRLGEWTGLADPADPDQALDECGLWHRVLTQADVTNLYNGGAALPLSSFTT